MARELWPGSYGPGAMARKLWPGSYGPGAMARELWPGSYGPGAMARELWPGVISTICVPSSGMLAQADLVFFNGRQSQVA